MEQIMEKARELGEMLAQSEPFTQMVKLEQAAMEDADITDIYGEYSDLREQLEALDMGEEGGDVAADNLRRDLDALEEQLNNRPEIRDLEAARASFNALMAQVNRVLQIALQGEDEDEGCGEGGCAGCQGCSVR
jgi:cell fate (sporulation/competence/biofilm development) regulator YlbF (YheA/YmcA/DUF963 family)